MQQSRASLEDYWCGGQICGDIEVLHVVVLHIVVLHIVAIHIVVLHIVVIHIVVLHIVVLHIVVIHVVVGRVNFCQKHPNMSAESFYCVFWYTDQPQKISA